LPNTAVKDTLDFIVIGAQKSGTTSLFEYLRRHEEVSLPADKEAPYFSHDATMSRGWKRYMETTFGGAEPARKWGTVTTHYMVGGVYKRAAASSGTRGEETERIIPLRIRDRLPDVRLIALLRDPVERARSHHRMALMNGTEERTFEDAVDQLLQPQQLRCSRACPTENTGYITWGEYGRILAGYFAVFSPEQLLVVFTEELEGSPERLLRRVYDFLGVAQSPVPDNVAKRYRESSSTRRVSIARPELMQATLARNVAMRTMWHAMPESARRFIDRRYTHFSYRFELWNRRVQAYPQELDAATLEKLRSHFRDDSERLSELLGRYPPWLERRATT
jgi:hypothetical protein